MHVRDALNSAAKKHSPQSFSHFSYLPLWDNQHIPETQWSHLVRLVTISIVIPRQLPRFVSCASATVCGSVHYVLMTSNTILRFRASDHFSKFAFRRHEINMSVFSLMIHLLTVTNTQLKHTVIWLMQLFPQQLQREKPWSVAAKLTIYNTHIFIYTTHTTTTTTDAEYTVFLSYLYRLGK